MERIYNTFTVSIFFNCDLELFTATVNQIKLKKIKEGKIDVLKTMPSIRDYFDPPCGGAHFPKFCFWVNPNYDRCVFFISNYEDGLSTLCNVIHHRIRGVWVMCTFSNDSRVEYPCYKFHYSDSNFYDRDILAYKEDRWIFYEQGTPLAFENTDYYKNKFIKKRLNNEIIEEYLLKLGINLCDIDSEVGQCMTYVQNAW